MRNLAKIVAHRKKGQAETQQAPVAPVTTMATVAQSVMLYRTLMTLAARVATARGNRDDFAKARTLRNIAATEGFSRGLVEMLNADGSAAKVFTNFPAVESLDSAGLASKSRRAQQALAGIDEVLALEADVNGTDVCAVVDATLAALKVFCDSLDQREAVGEALVAKLAEATVDEALLGATQVTACTAAAYKDEIGCLTAVATSMATPPNFAGLTTDDVNKMQDDLAKAVECLAPGTGLSIEDGEVTVDSDAVAEDNKPRAGSLAELGYTVDATAGLVQQMLGLIDVLENVRDNLPAIEAGFQTAMPAKDEADAAAGDEAPADGAETSDAGSDEDKPATEEDGESDEGGTDDGEGDEPPATDEGGEGEDGAGDGDSEGDEDDGEGEGTTEVASSDDVCRLVCNVATVVSAVINSSATLIGSLSQIGETVVALAATAPAPAEGEGEGEPTEPAAPNADDSDGGEDAGNADDGSMA